MQIHGIRRGFPARLMVLILALVSLLAAAPVQPKSPEATDAPVRFGHATLFMVRRGLGPFTAQQRADAISARLEQTAHQHLLTGFTVVVTQHSDRADVVLNGNVLTTVSNDDAHADGQERAAGLLRGPASPGRAPT